MATAFTGTTRSGRTYRQETEFIDITSSSAQPDPYWKGTCPNGHEITWKTMVWWVDEVELCDGSCGDLDHWEQIGHYECPDCDAHVDGGMIPPGHPTSIPGMTSYFVDDEQVSEEAFLMLLNEDMSK